MVRGCLQLRGLCVDGLGEGVVGYLEGLGEGCRVFEDAGRWSVCAEGGALNQAGEGLDAIGCECGEVRALRAVEVPPI